MGLLDDAIREHLDLKRRRGADPTEVQRAEREALGPVRRGPEALEQLNPPIGDPYVHDEDRQHWHEPAQSAAGFAATHAAEDDYRDQLSNEEPTIIERPPPAEPPRIAQGDQSDHTSIDLDEPEPGVHRTTPAPHPAPASSMPAQQGTQLGEETAEYESVPPVETDESDDMLEETPEFLQDTPDHDRLWFEQRPPRDFDFDS